MINLAIRLEGNKYTSGKFIDCLDKLNWADKDGPIFIFNALSNEGIDCPIISRSGTNGLCMCWKEELAELTLWLYSDNPMILYRIGLNWQKPNVKQTTLRKSATLIESWANFLKRAL